jgi:predicted dithiol-disulfide oxidoreductase (DUF899 family)
MNALEDAKTLVAKTENLIPETATSTARARTLLAEEIELRRLARVAKQRRNLPLGGELPLLQVSRR